MTRGASASALGDDFDGFLFAVVRDDSRGRLSVVSALARLDLDPWQTAAALARMPRAEAKSRLISLLSNPPNEADELDAAASRLIDLLPKPASPRGPSSGVTTDATRRSARFMAFYIVSLLAVWGVQSLVHSHALSAQGRGHSSILHAIAPPAPK
jgi:hypothetical protein